MRLPQAINFTAEWAKRNQESNDCEKAHRIDSQQTRTCEPSAIK